jgi:hypothetical protein
MDLTIGLAENEADVEMWDRIEMAKKGHNHKNAWWKVLKYAWA